MDAFARDRLTLVLYALLAWFAYLQAAPGLVLPHLRDELDLGYAAAGAHVAAFAAGSVVAGLVSERLEARIGRGRVLWASAAVLAAGTVALTVAHVVALTLTAVAVMGLGGGLVLVTVQSGLSDRHGERRAVALTEANVAAAASYVVLVGALSLAGALGASWRLPLLACLLVPVLAWVAGRQAPVPAAPHEDVPGGRLPRVFAIAAAMLFCTTAAEWCVTAWGASFVTETADVSADTGVTVMGAYFAGFLLGRVAGSRLARQRPPDRLLGLALAVAAVGFVVLWPSTAVPPAAVGLFLLGVGIGNLFPMALSVVVALAPGRAGLASGRAVTASSFAVLLAPLVVGGLADATSLRTALLVIPVALAAALAGLLLVRAEG